MEYRSVLVGVPIQDDAIVTFLSISAPPRRVEGDSQHHGQAHHTPALSAKIFGTLAGELLQILRGQAVYTDRCRERNSVYALGGAEWEGRRGVTV